MLSSKINFSLNTGLLIVLSLTFTSCLPDNSCDQKPNTAVNLDQLEIDIEKIEDYLSNEGLEAEIHKSGIRYIIDAKGEGKSPTLCNQVTVSYDGFLISDGSEFDSSEGKNIALSLSQVITGWQVGVPLIKEGGSITLYIPSVYAYGTRGSGNRIPPNANLIFTVNLVKVF